MDAIPNSKNGDDAQHVGKSFRPMETPLFGRRRLWLFGIRRRIEQQRLADRAHRGGPLNRAAKRVALLEPALDVPAL